MPRRLCPAGSSPMCDLRDMRDYCIRASCTQYVPQAIIAESQTGAVARSAWAVLRERTRGRIERFAERTSTELASRSFPPNVATSTLPVPNYATLAFFGLSLRMPPRAAIPLAQVKSESSRALANDGMKNEAAACAPYVNVDTS